jgi:predicted SnoaL-like aldol condensation-catalyzing enzyme
MRGALREASLKRALLLTAASAAATLALAATMPATAQESLAPPHAPIVEGKAVPVVEHPNQQALLESDDPELARNKKAAFDLWRTVLVSGQVEKAADYMTEGYIQHNPTAPTGRAAFEEIFRRFVPRQETVSETIPGLVSILAEDDKVVFALRREYDDPTAPGEKYTTTWFDMWRMEDGKLAEHWDVQTLGEGQNLTPESEGGPIPVTGATGADQLALLESDDPELAANKKLVFDVWRNIVDAGNEQYALEAIDEGYIQHNPNAATGRAGMMAYFSTRPDQPVQEHTNWPIVDVVAEGDLVAIVFVRELPIPANPDATYTTIWADMFRIEDGKIAEHWDIAQKAAPPPTAAQ